MIGDEHVHDIADARHEVDRRRLSTESMRSADPRVDRRRKFIPERLERGRCGAGNPRVVSTCNTMSTSLVGLTTPMPARMPWSWVMRPPTSVHPSCGSTASISATFGQGEPQPPGGLGTSIVSRSATEPGQRIDESIETNPTLTDVERLGEVERRQGGSLCQRLHDRQVSRRRS